MPQRKLSGHESGVLAGYAALPPTAQDFYRELGNKAASHDGGDLFERHWVHKSGLNDLWQKGLVHAGEVMYACDLVTTPLEHLSSFRAVVRDLINAGHVPTPARLAPYGYAYPASRSGGGSLKSGRYGVARRQEMLAAGYTFKDGRWRQRFGRTSASASPWQSSSSTG